jgi:hypothetical protein
MRQPCHSANRKQHAPPLRGHRHSVPAAVKRSEKFLSPTSIPSEQAWQITPQPRPTDRGVFAQPRSGNRQPKLASTPADQSP